MVESLIAREHMVNIIQKHVRDGNDRFLLSPPSADLLKTQPEIRAFLAFHGGMGALYQKRLDIGSSAAATDGFLLAGALIVGRNQTRPRTKMTGGKEHQHVYSDFSDDTEGGVNVLDTGNRQ